MSSILNTRKSKINLLIEQEDQYFSRNQNDITTGPKIIPMYNGQELNIDQSLIRNSLSTISIRNIHRSNNENTIKKRNSFFNLHRPELKGLNIILSAAESQTDNMLHKCILKEVKTIDKINSMRSIYKSRTPQCSTLTTKQSDILGKAQSETEQLKKKYFLKRSKSLANLIAPTESNCQILQLDNDSDIGDEVSLIPADEDKCSAHDVEIKSTLID